MTYIDSTEEFRYLVVNNNNITFKGDPIVAYLREAEQVVIKRNIE